MRLAYSARLALGAALGLCILAGIASAALWPGQAMALGGQLSGAVRDAGALGVAAFALAQVLVALSGILPAALLGAAAGAIYGPVAGFAIAAFSTLLGAQLAFHASRGLLRPLAERALAGRPHLAALDGALAREGWRIVCLMRISPVMPFSATSFALGLSSVGARDYALGTLAALPALLGYVVMGWLARDGVSAGLTGAGPLRIGLLLAGVAATAALTLKMGKVVGVSFSPRIRVEKAPA